MHKIICGKSEDVLPGLNQKFDLLFSSPPYNIGKSYEVRTSLNTYLDEQKKILDKVVPLVSDRGNICWQVGHYIHKGKQGTEVHPLDFYYYELFKSYGLKYRNRIIWHFGHGLHCTHRFSGRHETIIWFSKTDDYIFNLPSFGEPLGPDVKKVLRHDWEHLVWNIPNVKSNHPEKTKHPCQFPVELVERCVLVLSNPGSWVLDIFGGVGSTVIGSIKNGRNAVSIDKEQENCDIAKQRVKDFYAGTLKLRPMTKPIHKPKK